MINLFIFKSLRHLVVGAVSVFFAAEVLAYSDSINWIEDGQAAYLTCSNSGSSLVCQYHTASQDGSFTKSTGFFTFQGVRFQWRQPGATNKICAYGTSASGGIINCWDTSYNVATQILTGSAWYQNLVGEDSDGSALFVGDLILNQYDNCDYIINVNQLNTDGDPYGNACDTDDDNDGVLDVNDVFPLNPTEWLDTDSDTIGNNTDWDDDGDGIPDGIDANPLSAANSTELILPLDSTHSGAVLNSAVQR